MRSRVIAVGAALTVALGIGATGASAKSVLWLQNFVNEHAAPGTAAYVNIDLGNGCESVQNATLANNGQASVSFDISPASPVVECETGKLAATLSSYVAKPSSEEEMTATAKGSIHVLTDPWCVYTLPKTITMAHLAFTGAETSLAGVLDKAATFGSCPSTRSFPATVKVEEAFSSGEFFALIEG